MTDEKKAFVTMDVVALERLIPRHAYVGDLTLTENLHNYIEWLKAEVDHWKDAAWRAAVAQDEARAEVERLRGMLTEQGILLARLGIEKPELDALVQASWRTVAERQKAAMLAAINDDNYASYDGAEVVRILNAVPLVTEGEP